MTVAASGVLIVALVWSLYPALYVAAVWDSDVVLACGWLLAFELGKLVMAVGLAGRSGGGGPVGLAGWQRSPWFWLSVWHGTVNLWFAIGAAYVGAGSTVLVMECWPLPSGLLLVWGRQGWTGLRASLTPMLALAGLLCVAGVFLVVDSGRGGIPAGAGSWGWLLGVGTAFVGLLSASARCGAVLFAGSGTGSGWPLGRADAWHIAAYICGAAVALLAGLAFFGLGGVSLGWLLIAGWYGVATMAGHRYLNRLLSIRQEPALHLLLYALPFAGVGWLWLLGLERPAQPGAFLLGGGLILVGNLLALRRLR